MAKLKQKNLSFVLVYAVIVFMSFTSKSAIGVGETLNVVNFGAKPNGKTDSTKAILDIWTRACSSTTPTTIYVPKGKFLVDSNVDGVSIIGKGVFDGQSKPLWDCKRFMENCPMGATILGGDVTSPSLLVMEHWPYCFSPSFYRLPIRVFGSVSAWVQLLLLPRCTLHVVKPQNRRDRRSGNRKSSQQHHVLGCLATWREPDGLAKLVHSVLDNYGHAGLGSGRENIEEENSKMNTNIKQCLRKVADGHFTAAVKVLGSSGVAPYNEDTLKILEEKHPYMSPPTAPTTRFIEAPLVVEVDTVLKCIQSFPKGTSCGRDGLRAQHLLDAMCGEGSPVARDLLDAITLVVNLWLGGRCPSSLSEL
ncbi:hypothetical protein TSUD_327220 [Trifolium subterraneum]|uniref:Rhamnogalacturonase A/B/Epimerase-like pectate lyase domain-containing protein n=1 Tax=Trifolium subterraneum TaxID=3900 RepID=A0A2Z6PNY7_TRISU|nr:hypothetical protein TSUD_327220 [Trifolium subterraneum]